MVNTLRNSLSNDLIVIETYSNKLRNLSKIFNLYTFLKYDTRIPDNHVIVFTDAYDVICNRYDKESMLNTFLSKKKDIIIGAEIDFSHHSRIVKPFFDSTYASYKLKYLNGGFIIAYKWAYLKLLDHIVTNYKELYETPNITSDQRLLSKFMVYNQELNLVNMDLDNESVFVFNYTHSIPKTPLTSIKSYFIHVTNLKSPDQLAKYNELLKPSKRRS